MPTLSMTDMEMAATGSLQHCHHMTKMVYQFESDAKFLVTPKRTKLHKAGCGHILGHKVIDAVQRMHFRYFRGCMTAFVPKEH